MEKDIFEKAENELSGHLESSRVRAVKKLSHVKLPVSWLCDLVSECAKNYDCFAVRSEQLRQRVRRPSHQPLLAGQM